MTAVRLKPAIFLSGVIPAAGKSNAGFYKKSANFHFIHTDTSIFLFPMNRDIYVCRFMYCQDTFLSWDISFAEKSCISISVLKTNISIQKYGYLYFNR